MRTKAHWEACKEQASYHAAQNLAFQLREIAKKEGYDPNGIRVLDKRAVLTQGQYYADAQVSWQEGPPGWTDAVELTRLSSVCATVENDFTISYYDV
jgi:hypothetical protein